MNPLRRSLAWICTSVLVLGLTVGCTTSRLSLPAVTETPDSDRHPGKFIWRDLITDTPAASRTFYETLFGWEFQSVGDLMGMATDSTYTLIRHNGRLIGGMVDAKSLGRSEDVAQWVAVMSVADVQQAVATVASQGGQVLTPPLDVADRGTMAVVTDPQGALLGLLQTRSGDPADLNPDYGDFLWDELWTTDVAAATEFYQALAGYDRQDLPAGNSGHSYRVLQGEGVPRAGVLAQPFSGERPVWVTYIRVRDPAAITSRVEALGGTVYVEAQTRPIGGTVALIADPSGAGIALQTWPLENLQETAR